MHPDFYQLIELGIGLALLGLGYGVKLLAVNQRLHRRLRGTADQRLADAEERCDRMAEVIVRQEEPLEEYRDRLEFDERLLADRHERQPHPPHSLEPVSPV